MDLNENQDSSALYRINTNTRHDAVVTREARRDPTSKTTTNPHENTEPKKEMIQDANYGQKQPQL